MKVACGYCHNGWIAEGLICCQQCWNEFHDSYYEMDVQ